MAGVYSWTTESISSLSSLITQADTALNDSLNQVNTLITDMQTDITWSGEYKRTFLEFMDLLQQFHTLLAKDTVGKAVANTLNDFINNHCATFESTSAMANLDQIPN